MKTLLMLCTSLLATATLAAPASPQPAGPAKPASRSTPAPLASKPTAKPAAATAAAGKPATSPVSRPTSPTAPAPRSLAEAAALRAAGQTNIMAKVDSPLVTNIIAWEERPAVAPKIALEFSALKENLLPTDRDQLQNEIRYTQMLNQPAASDGRPNP
mgnify:CR=1 FL=1